MAVLNGTTFTGLAGRIADEVAQEGYVRGISETNTRDQTIEDSVVYYADGMRASAQQVARLLSIDQVEAIDSETQAHRARRRRRGARRRRPSALDA